jgi:hypothetical protein
LEAVTLYNGSPPGGIGPAYSQITALLPSTQPLGWRDAYRSSTQYLVASDLNNQGTVTSGQFPARLSTIWPLAVFSPTAIPNSQGYTIKVLELPLNEADMTAWDPKIRVAPAKQGCYQPLYNMGPTFEFGRGAGMPSVGLDYNTVSGSFNWYMP